MRIRARRHLRKVRHAKNLVAGGKARELLADLRAYLAAHICVNFVEYENRRGIRLRENRFEREHHAGKLPARCDFSKRQKRLSRICRKREFARAPAVRRRLGNPREPDVEARVFEAEPQKGFRRDVREFARRAGAQLEDFFRDRGEFGKQRRSALFKAGDGRPDVGLHLYLAGHFRARGEHLPHAPPVFAA